MDDLFPMCENSGNYLAVVIFPDAVTCLRKPFPTIYLAKLWIVEKIFIHKHPILKEFPFNFEYCVTLGTEIISQEQLNLPY